MAEEKLEPLDNDRYRDLFVNSGAQKVEEVPTSVHKKALETALEVRRFEIELYWKRAAYFWAFIGAAFVGYATYFKVALNSGKDGSDIVLLMIACLGFIFSMAWVLVNKGSKYWQENWENHVELLEDDIQGPLFKTMCERPKAKGKEWFKAFFVAPSSYSVSSVNLLVSWFVLSIWVFLIYKALGVISNDLPLDFEKIAILLITSITLAGLLRFGKSHKGPHEPKVFLRATSVTEPIKSEEQL